ncbi:MAG: nucleoside-diphosphate-sugar epimerase [Gammaproteobacteria bacterium]|jgi:nucleoside-diphosphate-sugar epimerase
MSELVALTGATGFIGNALLLALANSGRRVRALSRQRRGHNELAEWVSGDLNSPQALIELVDGADTVIHCAGAVRGKSEEEFLSINDRGTANLLTACKSQSQHQRFLLISSLAAREPTLSWYALSKRRAEQTLQSHSDNMTCTVLRPTAVYGPGDKEIRPLLQAMKSGLLPVPNIKSQFSLLHINDLVAAILKWAAQSPPISGVYELDDGTANGYNWETLAELARDNWQRSVIKIPIPIALLKMLAVTNLGLARLLHYSPMLTPGKVCEITHPDWICDNTPLSRSLDWQPGIRLADAMREPSLLQL